MSYFFSLMDNLLPLRLLSLINRTFRFSSLLLSLWVVDIDFRLYSFYLSSMLFYRSDDICIISLLFWLLWLLSRIYPVVWIGWDLIFLLDLIYVFWVVVWFFWLFNKTRATYYMNYVIFVHDGLIAFCARLCPRLASFKMSLKASNRDIQLTIFTKLRLQFTILLMLFTIS